MAMNSNCSWIKALASASTKQAGSGLLGQFHFLRFRKGTRDRTQVPEAHQAGPRARD
jgi:hypothetical protein